MKKLAMILCLILIIAGAFLSPRKNKPGIHGLIEPADAASKVLAIRGTDSVAAVPVSGRFSMEVKPGTWSLLVRGISPYKNAVVENIMVLENQSTDAGTIKLVKE